MFLMLHVLCSVLNLLNIMLLNKYHVLFEFLPKSLTSSHQFHTSLWAFSQCEWLTLFSFKLHFLQMFSQLFVVCNTTFCKSLNWQARSCFDVVNVKLSSYFVLCNSPLGAWFKSFISVIRTSIMLLTSCLFWFPVGNLIICERITILSNAVSLLSLDETTSWSKVCRTRNQWKTIPKEERRRLWR